MVDVNWSGGLEPAIDGQILSGRPDDPEMRESASIWLFEENGAFALPRVGIEAVGADWDAHRYDLNMAMPDGRILRQSTRGATMSSLNAAGESRVLGAGGLRFECLEPFRKWRVSFDDTMIESTVQQQIAGNFRVYCGQEVDPALRRTPVKWEVELDMATPGWTQDFRPERLAGLSERERSDAGLMGFGWRVEHTFRGEGELTIDGQARTFRCVGNRIHRQSVRPMGTFRGHCWQAALFPDGRAFGHITYPPSPDGSTYNDAYLWQDGKWYRGRSIDAPFLRRIMPEGDDVSVKIETELGVTEIGGETLLSTFHIGNPGVNGMNNQQGTVRYTLDGQQALGMIERSSPVELCEVVG